MKILRPNSREKERRKSKRKEEKSERELFVSFGRVSTSIIIIVALTFLIERLFAHHACHASLHLDASCHHVVFKIIIL